MADHLDDVETAALITPAGVAAYSDSSNIYDYYGIIKPSKAFEFVKAFCTSI